MGLIIVYFSMQRKDHKIILCILYYSYFIVYSIFIFISKSFLI